MNSRDQISRFAFLAAILCPAQAAFAQQAAPDNSPRPASETRAVAAGVGLEDIVVTARKRAEAERLQDVPIAVAAVSGDQLERNQIRQITQLTGSIPNVAMDEVGSAKGTANISIRGLGFGATLPTLENAAGVFVDGVYLASIQGVIFDLVDLDGIEVLRGPQGTLFGKNVTAGALLIRSRKPSDKFEGTFRASVETGLEYKLAGTVSGPISDTIRVRLSAQYDHDNGWFTNDFTGKSTGSSTNWLVRSSLTWEPTPDFDVTLRYEHGSSDTNGLPVQNLAFNDRHSFHFNQDWEGGTTYKWDFATAEANWRVGFGDGTITDVAGYRNLSLLTDYEIPGSPIQDYQIAYSNPVKQFSNELRYAGTFFDGFMNITTGLYYFTSDIQLYETRRLITVASFAPRSYGGINQKAYTYAAFGQADFNITPTLTLTAGGRYTYDKKRADIGLYTAAADTCARELSYMANPKISPPSLFCNFAFPNQRDHWGSFSPKLGVQFKPTNDAQLYATWTKAYRAGGFNSRVTATNQQLEWNQESTEAYEVGGKADLLDRRLRINVAAFRNKIKDMIRLVQTPGASGVVADTRNTGDATIWGAEFEGQAVVSDHFTLRGFAGYQHGKYDNLRFSLVDLPGEPVATVTQNDYNLKFVRLSPWTYGVGATYVFPINDGMNLSTRADFSHRDRAFATDDNKTKLNAWNNLDASTSLSMMEDRLTFTVFGRNLLNKTYHGLQVFLPAALMPPIPAGRQPIVGWLSEGRVIGIEANLKFR